MARKHLAGVGLVALGLILGAAMVGAQPAPADRPAPKAADRAALEKLAFLAGTWTGAMGKDSVEETWSVPRGDTIVGMFRWQLPDGTTSMYELLAIRAEAAGPTLRLRHFDGAFEPWKAEAGGLAAMPATVLEPGRVVFTTEGDKGGLTSVEYHCPTADELRITVNFRQAGREPLNFTLKRASARAGG
ncbi:MAG: hypothetical protein KIT68_05280 [Phycisphaeraceae bacterium]|nr:hypothetical protein [Phycisphaeraceae bacterium]